MVHRPRVNWTLDHFIKQTPLSFTPKKFFNNVLHEHHVLVQVLPVTVHLKVSKMTSPFWAGLVNGACDLMHYPGGVSYSVENVEVGALENFGLKLSIQKV